MEKSEIKKVFEKELKIQRKGPQWFEVSQEVINQFADATLDHQFIHVSPEEAEKTQFESTIAHGFLLVSLLPYLSKELMHFEVAPDMLINKGLEKLDFKEVVRSGDLIKLQMVLEKCAARNGMAVLNYKFSLLKKDSDKICMEGNWKFVAQYGEK